MTTASRRTSLLAWTLLTFGLLVAWDSLPLDLVLARQVGTAAGFALRDDWWLNAVLHTAAKWFAWGLQGALLVAIWRPMGPLRRLSRPLRVQLAVSTLACLLVISGLKSFSLTSCPWELSDFGGAAHPVSHWLWGVRDGGHGRCFPAGHASTGFAFIGGFFVFRRQSPGMARAWLLGALAFGFTLGIGQQLRGAHFMSHTLWTAWLCWTTAWMVNIAAARWPHPAEPAHANTAAQPLA